jgi:hypothetical protein
VLKVVSGLIERIDSLISSQRIFAPALVKEEIEAVGTAGLIQWTENHAGIFAPTNELLAETQTIQNQFTGLRDPRAEYEEAEAYVIALAKMRNGIVVTQETPPRKNKSQSAHILFPTCAAN